jgi:hypothetical protein
MRRARRAVGLCAVALIAGMPGMLSASPAGASDHTVAVALFYAPTPLAPVPELIPEEYASADMSARLAAASAGLAVVPRAQVKAEENALHWREADVLRFARLGELAQAVGADRVVVGWIRQLALDRLGGNGTNLDIGGGGGGGLIDGLAVVVVQVFDAPRGRIVYQTQVEGHGTGGLPTQVAQQAVDDAVRRGATRLIGPLTGASAGP